MGFLQDQCSFGFYNHEKADTSKPFRCGDDDLDEFFTDDAFLQSDELLCKNYCFTLDDDPSVVGNIQFRPPFCTFNAPIASSLRKKLYLCSRYNTLMRIIMSNEEKKERMARNYAINSKKTPRTRRMAFARAHAGGIIITDPKLKERLTTYAD